MLTGAEGGDGAALATERREHTEVGVPLASAGGHAPVVGIRHVAGEAPRGVLVHQGEVGLHQILPGDAESYGEVEVVVAILGDDHFEIGRRFRWVGALGERRPGQGGRGHHQHEAKARAHPDPELSVVPLGARAEGGESGGAATTPVAPILDGAPPEDQDDEGTCLDHLHDEVDQRGDEGDRVGDRVDVPRRPVGVRGGLGGDPHLLGGGMGEALGTVGIVGHGGLLIGLAGLDWQG